MDIWYNYYVALTSNWMSEISTYLLFSLNSLAENTLEFIFLNTLNLFPLDINSFVYSKNCSSFRYIIKDWPPTLCIESRIDKDKVFYSNAKKARHLILEDNKGKSGIYLWYNNATGKYYIGQAKDLGDRKQGRLNRYYRPSYLGSKSRGSSAIRAAFIKYGHEFFSLYILEYCLIVKLDEREQYWIDILKPLYNILNIVKSSRGYKHTEESLLKMRGTRPQFKPSLEHRAAIAKSNRKENRNYDKTFSNSISERLGRTIFVYDSSNKLINTFSSIIRLKTYYGITIHHNTLYKRIENGILFNGHKFSFSLINTITD